MRFFRVSVLAATLVALPGMAFAHGEQTHVNNYEPSFAYNLAKNDWPTMFIYAQDGISQADGQTFASVLSEERYRWAHVVVVDERAHAGIARWLREGDVPYVVVRANDYVRQGNGELDASTLRAELDRALRAPVGRASVD